MGPRFGVVRALRAAKAPSVAWPQCYLSAALGMNPV